MCCFHVNLQPIVQPRYVQCSDGEMHVPSTVMCTAPGFRFMQKTMRTVLAPLKVSFASWPQTAAKSHIDCKFLAARSSETADVTKTRSSAYAIILKRKENSEWRKESINRSINFFTFFRFLRALAKGIEIFQNPLAEVLSLTFCIKWALVRQNLFFECNRL